MVERKAAPRPEGRGPERRGGESASLERLQTQGRRVQRDAASLATGLEEAFGEFAGLAEKQLRERPYTTLAAASGIGWVLGGGIPSPLARLLIDQGSRLAFGLAMARWVARGADEERSTS